MEFLDASAAKSLSLEDADVYYSPSYGLSAELIDGGTWECAVSGDGLVFPYIRREIDDDGYDIVSPYGYGGVQAPSPEALASFRREFRTASLDRGLVAEFLRGHPLDMNDAMLDAWRPDSVSRHTTFGVMADGDPEDYFEQAQGRHRTAVRKAVKNGIRVSEVDPHTTVRSDSPFRRIYADTMARVGASSRLHLGDDYFHRLTSLGPDRLTVLEATADNSETVAAAMFMRSGSRVHYHLSGATLYGQKYGATNLLIDHVVRTQLPSHGWLHLGGGVSDDDGLSRFKRSIGNVTHSMAMCRTIINSSRYEALVAAAGYPDSSFFPAYRESS
ncbi:GNAT family N-acetyltransferase [Janibacter corallicola]|uniref:GNAT family N-acetyltransferase n=1 Tax=Janibacter corallicola TaxID=415212 RepID=UPI000B0EB924|nr:GNAT family N-acetyltransferase [Janibacter corallicola]